MSSGTAPYRRPKIIWFLFGAVGLGATLLAAAISMLAYHAWRYDWFGEYGVIGANSYLTSEYDDMEFGWCSDHTQTDQYCDFTTGSATRLKGSVAPLYLRSKATGKLYFLPDFSIDDYFAITGVDRSHLFETEIDGELWSSVGSDKFRFRNGELSSVTLDANNATFEPWQFEIGPSKAGEFIALPAPRENVHRIFGPPRRFKRYRGGGM